MLPSGEETQDFTCAVKSHGEIGCWGNNTSAQLGNGTFASAPSPVAVEGVKTAVRVSAGPQYTCAVLSSGEAQCWGGTQPISPLPINVQGLSEIQDISAGNATCTVSKAGQVACWGGSHFGFGAFDVLESYTSAPVLIDGIDDAVEIGVSHHGSGTHACARTRSGSIRCWGSGSWGELGDGSSTAVANPVQLPGMEARDIDAGSASTCAILTDDRVVCWGRGFAHTPQPLDPQPFATPVALGMNDNWVCIASDSVIDCNLVADMFTDTTPAGDENTELDCSNDQDDDNNGLTDCEDFSCEIRVECVPQQRFPIAQAVHIDLGVRQGCAVIQDGSVVCWNTPAPEMFTTPEEINPNPRPVEGLADVVDLAIGNGFGCALTSTGTVSCWGSNEFGGLGDGSGVDSESPILVGGLTDVIAIHADNTGVCALQTDGRILCWGTIAAFPDALTPVEEGIYKGAKDLFLSLNRICRLYDDGSSDCHSSEVLSDTRDIALGGQHTCALLANQEVWCWGSRIGGRIGEGFAGGRYTPEGEVIFP